MATANHCTNNYNSAYHDFLDSLQTGDSGALARTVLTKNWPYLLIGLLLFLVGLTLQLFLLSLTRQSVTIHSSVYYCDLFILSASLWVLLNPAYSTLLFDNAPLIMLIETISMWLFSTFLFGYFGTFMQTRAKSANDLLLICFAFALVLFLVLQLFGVTDAYAVREPHNILLGVSAVVLLCIFWYEIHHAKKSKLRTLALPGLLYGIFGLIEMANYEMEHIMDYLYLEKMRFPKKLKIVMDISYRDFLLPPLSLQPIIENATRHGITKKKSGGTLTVRCERMEETVVITIHDDGVGFDPTEKIVDGRSHLGVENTRKRLEMLCGGSLLFESSKGRVQLLK